MMQEFDQLPTEWKEALSRGETVTLKKAGKVTATIVPSHRPEHLVEPEVARRRADAWRQFVQKHSRALPHPVDTSRDQMYGEGD